MGMNNIVFLTLCISKTILVKRGWIPAEYKDPSTRKELDLESRSKTTKLHGYLKLPEQVTTTVTLLVSFSLETIVCTYERCTKEPMVLGRHNYNVQFK
jgi:hypothetical protein